MILGCRVLQFRTELDSLSTPTIALHDHHNPSFIITVFIPGLATPRRSLRYSSPRPALVLSKAEARLAARLPLLERAGRRRRRLDVSF